ncbi:MULTISPECIES: response regulator [Desulfosediminicola]|uniref:response regulator n=1 Tax=Desulfosediminicola TaxID=2886823 RepID=UPI0010ABB1D6|nr:response regulator [Desulfosediminicola ganghwensis]
MVEIQNTRVLLVDDEDDFLTTLASRLELRDLKVSTATRGEDALEVMSGSDVDVVVLDLSMPGMDGLETLKRIKSQVPEAEVLILTGHGSIRAGVEAMKLGAEDFIEKPVDINELLEKIEDAKQKRVLVLQSKSREQIDKILKARPW